MMNQKTLLGLGVATLLAVVAAAVINHSRQPSSGADGNAGLLVPGLTDKLDGVNKVELTTANATTAVILEQKDGRWVVAQRGGYPADVGKLRAWLLKIADAKLLEQKTSDATRYAELGVNDIKSQDAKGIGVRIDGLAAPVEFIVGLPGVSASDTYVRRGSEAQSWLAKGSLLPDKQPSDWLQKDLANIPSDRIAEVTITHADGRLLHVSKATAKDAQYAIADIPKGREASSEFAANGLASVLSELRLDDVAPSSEIPVPADATLARYQTFDGLVVEAREWKVGDKPHVAFNASLDESVAMAHAKEMAEAAKPVSATPEVITDSPVAATENKGKADDATPSSDAPAKNPQQQVAELKTEVESLNAKFKGWSFVLPAYKIGNIDKRMEDLLKPKAEPKPDKK